MTDVLDNFFETIIETLVLTPIFIVITFLLLLVVIFYPIQRLRKWFGKQALRIVDIWIYYVENAYKYEEEDYD
jgi:hypothetical protein